MKFTVSPEEKSGLFWHRPLNPNGAGLVLTHGAGADAQAPLLQAVAKACCDAGVTVVRCNLAFRRKRPSGPPHPSGAGEDRRGLLEAAQEMRATVSGPIALGGHSYGGRQASILASEKRDACDRLLLLSYPLHPPGKPAQLRTEHFAGISVPVLFVSGSRDEFGSQAEFEREIPAFPAPIKTLWIAAAGHDLKKGKFDLVAVVDFVAKIG